MKPTARAARHVVVLAIAILLACPPWAAAHADSGERPTVALALGGGAARGLSHIGLLKALGEAGIPVDMLVGTSMGSLVAGMYASGLSVDNLTYLVTAVNLGELFEPLVPPRGGLVSAERLGWFLDAITGGATFDALPIPFYAVVTHLESGREVVWHRGPISRGMLASMAIPGAFPPVELDGEYYVDGGVASMVPVEAARRLGADVVIAVDVRGRRTTAVDVNSPLDVLNTALGHMLRANADAQLALADVVVLPDIPAEAHMEYDRAEEFIAAGYAAAQEALPQIRSVLLALDPDFPFGAKPPNEGLPAADFAARVEEALAAATADVQVLQLAALPAYEVRTDGAPGLQLGVRLPLMRAGQQPVYGIYSLATGGGTWVHTVGLGVGTCQLLCGAVFLRHGMDSQRWSPGIVLKGLTRNADYWLEWESQAAGTGAGWVTALQFPATGKAIASGRQLHVQLTRDPRGLYGPPRSAVRGDAVARWYLPAEKRNLFGFVRGATHWYWGVGASATWNGAARVTPVLEVGVVLDEHVFGLHPVRLRAGLTYRGDHLWALRLSVGE